MPSGGAGPLSATTWTTAPYRSCGRGFGGVSKRYYVMPAQGYYSSMDMVHALAEHANIWSALKESASRKHCQVVVADLSQSPPWQGVDLNSMDQIVDPLPGIMHCELFESLCEWYAARYGKRFSRQNLATDVASSCLERGWSWDQVFENPYRAISSAWEDWRGC